MSITQEEMKSAPTVETKADETGFVNPFDPKFEMSLEDVAKVYAQNGEEGEATTLGIVNGDPVPTVSEQQDELIREYLLAVLTSRHSSIHHFIVDAAGYILNDDSLAHEDAVKVLKTVTKYFQEKYVRQ